MAGRKKKLKILVDTCVWLDLARDYREQPVIAALADLIKARKIELILPQIVIDEFHRNKPRVVAETQRSLQSHFRLVREAVNRFGDDTSKIEILRGLSEIDHVIAIKGEAVNDSFKRIEELFRTAVQLEMTDAVKQRVTDRAIEKKAPYHRDKNSVADAILI